jgi:hypothetical protein
MLPRIQVDGVSHGTDLPGLRQGTAVWKQYFACTQCKPPPVECESASSEGQDCGRGKADTGLHQLYQGWKDRQGLVLGRSTAAVRPKTLPGVACSTVGEVFEEWLARMDLAAPSRLRFRDSSQPNGLSYFSFSNSSAAELMQYLRPVGLGPSGKTCPRWAPQAAQVTSTRRIPSELSSWVSTAAESVGK